MASSGILDNPEKLVGEKLGGFTLKRCLDYDAERAWYEAVEDTGGQAIAYLYGDARRRESDKPRVHGFRTTIDHTFDVDGMPIRVFANIGGYRVSLTRDLRTFLTSDQALRSLVANKYELLKVLGHGYKGVTYTARLKDGPGTQYALKLTVNEEYEVRSYLPEVHRMVDLARTDPYHFPHIHDSGEHSFSIDGAIHHFIYFVEDLMPGEPLERILDNRPGSLSVGFLERFVREMLQSLAVLEQHDLMHDDLHAGNIMIDESLPGVHVSLIDFGSAKARSKTRKPRDDIRNLASHVAEIRNVLDRSRKPRTRYDDRALSACESLHAVISDDDPLRRPDSAKALLGDFERYYPQGAYTQELTRPFDFGNAEEVMDNRLLQQLASRHFPWQDKIESSSNLLVIGPRGCGKTTVFRSMSFTCLADAGLIEQAIARPYLGLYISCNRDFRLRFSALQPDVLRRREADIRHYFNLLVLREFIGALIACQQKGLLGEHDIRSFLDFVRKDASLESGPLLPGEASLREMDARVAQAIGDARMNIWDDRPCPQRTEQDFVAGLGSLAARKISPFQGKLLYLLVDDYTERKVPREAQRALNHILFIPNGNYKSKVSSEVFGVCPDTTFGHFLDQDRDYKEWNLGTLYYLNLPSDEKKRFLREIVNTRLRLCQYEGTVDDVIGPSQYSAGGLSHALKSEAERVEGESKRPKAYYHGWDTICDLCTGDISNILEILDRMYSECGVSKSSKSLLRPEEQDRIIEAYSLQYIAKIKGIPQYGERLFEIVNAFGTMCARLLKQRSWIPRPLGRRDPYQLLRIELDEGFVRSSDHLLEFEYEAAPQNGRGSPEYAAIIWMLLQRYCILIDAEPSRSRRNTLASKVILRRIFCPAFRTGLVNSESFTLDKKHWQAFCSDAQRESARYVGATETPLLDDLGEAP